MSTTIQPRIIEEPLSDLFANECWRFTWYPQQGVEAVNGTVSGLSQMSSHGNALITCGGWIEAKRWFVLGRIETLSGIWWNCFEEWKDKEQLEFLWRMKKIEFLWKWNTKDKLVSKFQEELFADVCRLSS
jgi:hypothetical protein